MLYYVKNKSGNVSDVTEEIYNRLLDNDAYECWTEDPYANLPQEVTDNTPKSTDYTVREFVELAKDMNQEDLRAMIPESEERTTITDLLD